MVGASRTDCWRGQRDFIEVSATPIVEAIVLIKSAAQSIGCRRRKVGGFGDQVSFGMLGFEGCGWGSRCRPEFAASRLDMGHLFVPDRRRLGVY